MNTTCARGFGRYIASALLLPAVVMLSGCVVRSYPVTRERLDQVVDSGNQGYLRGEALGAEPVERKRTRTMRVLEVELHPPIKFEGRPKVPVNERLEAQKSEDTQAWGNRGYITRVQRQKAPGFTSPLETQAYTVQKGDTLQKISERFFGTTRKWQRIFETNKDMLKTPERIYPGQVINIPVEKLQETEENLK